MFELHEGAIDASLPTEHRSLPIAVGEQLSKDDDFGLNLTRVINHMASHLKGCPVQVVKTKPIELLGHQAHILFHVLPSRRVLSIVTVTDPYQISPHRHSSAQVVEVVGGDQVLGGGGVHHPSVIERVVDNTVGGLDSGEVGVDEGVGVVEGAVVVVEVVVADFLQEVFEDLRHPLLCDFLPPLVVELLDPQQQVRFLVGRVYGLPFF